MVHIINNPQLLYVKSLPMGSTSQLVLRALRSLGSPAQGAGEESAGARLSC